MMTRATDCAVTSKLNALAGCSSHHLQGRGHIAAAPTKGRTACLLKELLFRFEIFLDIYKPKIPNS